MSALSLHRESTDSPICEYLSSYRARGVAGTWAGMDAVDTL